MKETETHIYFSDGYLSSFYRSSHALRPMDGSESVDTSYHVYMIRKAQFFKSEELVEKILNSKTPKEVKELGEDIPNYDFKKWEKVRYLAMKSAVYLKFSENILLKESLIATGDKTLVNTIPHDKVWGIGLNIEDPTISDDKNWDGENLLGKALMEVRSVLKNEMF